MNLIREVLNRARAKNDDAEGGLMLACLTLRGGRSDEQTLCDDYQCWTHIHGEPTFEKLLHWATRFEDNGEA
jgi:hypothetical protein